MKTNKIVIALLALGASAWVIVAQDNGGPQDGPRPPRRPNMNNPDGQGGPGGPGMRGRRPVPLIISALDVNHDGVIDADEIANAPAALKKLDKNGDGKLTMDELMPPPPQGMGRPGQGGDQQDRPPGPPPGDQ